MTQTSPKPTPETPENSQPPVLDQLPTLALPEEKTIAEEPVSRQPLAETVVSSSDKKYSPVSGKTLRTKAGTAALLMGLIPVALVTLSAYTIAQNIIERQVKERIGVQAQSLSDRLQMFTGERTTDMISLAQQDSFANPKVRAVITNPERNILLNNYRANHPYYKSLTLYDTQGNLIASSGGTAAENRTIGREFTPKVLKAGKPVIGEPQYGKESDRSSFIIAVPVRDQNSGQILSVLAGRVPLSALDQQFSDTTKKGCVAKN